MSDLSHLGGSSLAGDPVTFCVDVWTRLLASYPIRSVLDIGCGCGFNTRWFLDQGLDAHGVEGFPEYVEKAVIPRDRITQHDFTTGPYLPGRRFDLGVCTEFVEHVEERFAGNFMVTFCACDYLLMSYAVPGQGGWHHVNERDSWVPRIESLGFAHLEKETAWMRATATPAAHYGRQTLCFFQRQ
jgi:hypothetical protein